MTIGEYQEKSLVGVVTPPIRGGESAEACGDDQRTATNGADWGQMPALSLVVAVGLLLVALADSGARDGAAWSYPIFWAGMLVLFVPVAARLGSAEAARQERICLVGMIGLALYLVKVLHSPLAFTFADEFAHWRTAQDILQSGHLFQHNPVLPITALYPGLDIVTAALASLSDATIFNAGIIVLGTARLVLILALYLFFEATARSARTAGIASLLYMANPNFVFFNAEFSYESLALPLVALTLFTLERRQNTTTGAYGALTLVIVLALGTIVITHHMTTYALVVFLVLWTVTTFASSRGCGDYRSLAQTTFLASVASLTWLMYVAAVTVGYIVPHVVGATGEVMRLIMREGTARQLFRTASGQLPPLWERLTSFAAVGLILLGLAFGLRHIWQRQRRNALALALSGVALAYPASLALRLTQAGAESSNRASEFLFAGIGFVLAIGFAEPWLARHPAPWRLVVFTGWVTTIFLGGTIVGWAPWARLPGSYLVSADTRSVELQGVAAAEWALMSLGPGNRIAADRTNKLLMGSYGAQHPVTGYGDGVDTAAVFFAEELGDAERALLQRGRVRYIVVDRRLSTGVPMVGVYFEDGEENTHMHTYPVDPAALTKFDSLQGVSRLFDSGDIAIYDVGALSDAP